MKRNVGLGVFVAERRKNVAPGASPGFVSVSNPAPEGAKESPRNLSLDTGALKTTEEKAEVPSLDKEGWLRPLRKWREASLAGTDGVVGSSHRLSEVERTTPFLMFRPTGLTLRAAPPKEREHFLGGAATPPNPGGEFGHIDQEFGKMSKLQTPACARATCCSRGCLVR